MTKKPLEAKLKMSDQQLLDVYSHDLQEVSGVCIFCGIKEYRLGIRDSEKLAADIAMNLLQRVSDFAKEEVLNIELKRIYYYYSLLKYTLWIVVFS